MTQKSLSLEHLVRPSSITDQKPPVLFMLHGYGSNEEDLFSFSGELPDELFIISVRAPYDLMPFGHAWYSINFDAAEGKWSDDEEARKSRDLILQFIEEACEAYGLDTDRVSLLGFSQGTILSYAVALSYPEKIRNVIGLSGYVNERILSPGYENKDHSHLQVYASHGSVDQVIPVEWARRVPGIMKDLNISHEYEEFPVGHGVAPQNFYSLKNWLTKKI
ncbi:alpha/beta hydrolase [Robertkochia aurantiaca]|uniref:alpha/beta hydrolase n=1 Tax=Robertkochia aurantiaca TaxID=2873700 RepID=UPI001CCB8FDE|nr:alpha/beta hydrolase-fold protein [Robertkochia sp. 3YJGBD-33]